MFCRRGASRIGYFISKVVLLMRLALSDTSAQIPYYFDRITTAQGLSQSTVNVIFQDSRGFMWFGTADGLNRYDGYEVRRFRYRANDPNSVCGNDIMAISEDANGNLWIGTRSTGLCYFDPKTEQFRTIRNTDKGELLSQYDVPALARTTDGTLWIGTSAGLFSVNPQTRQVVRFSDRMRQYISALLVDRQGALWMGTYLGQVLFKKPRQTQVTTVALPSRSPVSQHQWVTAIHQSSNRAIRVSTWGSGLYRWNETAQRFDSEVFFADEFEKRNIIKAVVEDKNRNLWLATDDGLLIASAGDTRQLTHLTAARSKAGGLTTHALQSLRCDSFGNVWIGTWEGGLNVYYSEAKRFNHLTQNDGLFSNRVTGVVANNQMIVASTGKGIQRIDRRTNVVSTVAQGEDVTALIQHDHQVAALVWNQGVDFYRSSPASLRQTGRHRDNTNPYRALAFTRQSGIVVANTAGLLLRINPLTSRLEPLPGFSGKSSFSVATTLLELQSGQLAIGSYNQGLWLYDPLRQQLRPAGHHKRIGTEQVLCLYEDSAGQLWVGTNGNGLFRYRPGTDDFQVFNTQAGLPSDVVKSIVEDATHHLWTGTNEGLGRLNPQRGTWRVYSEQDGLNNREFMAGAAFRDERGYLFFGGMDGMDYFHPDSLNETRQRPKVYLTGLRLLNRPVTATTEDTPLRENIGLARTLQLSYQQATSITFEFVGLFYQKTADCRYQYRLDNFDNAWNDVGTQRNATYTNLPPGQYTFRVKASNTDGVWTGQDARIDLTVLPPWYRSWWAYALYTMLLLAGLWSYRWFVRKQEKLEAEVRFRQLESEQAHELERLKTNFFTNVSHEFRTPLTLILDPVDQLLTGNLPAAKVQESYRVIQQNGQRLLRLINELLELSKIEADRYQLHIGRADIIDFLQKIVQSFQFQAERRHIDLVFQTDVDSYMVDFSADALEKITFNLIANALKASHPDEQVRVRVKPIRVDGQSARIRLVVQDTGIGLSEKDQQALFSRFFQASTTTGNRQMGTGIGLALTAELVKLHRGEIRFESQEGAGTTITVDLSVDAADFPADWIRAADPGVIEPVMPPALLSTGALPPASAASRKQLLVVEDNDELRTYLHNQLSAKYDVLIAENGKIGLQLALEHLPDLVISDLIMPELDGIELSKRLKTDEKTSHIPLILLTSRSSVESQLQGLSTGADDYQTKPFTFQVLEARIRNLITQRQRLRERFSRGMLLQPSQITVNDTDEEFLKKAIALIEAHISDSTFDVERLEKALSMSQMQLYRKLTSLTNMSGNVFIRHIRLHRAKQLLEESNLTVAEIAYRVGFNSPSYFTRAYKKEFGVLPSDVNV